MGAKEDHEQASKIAEWLGLAEDEVTDFINGVMKRKGHKPVLSWADGEGTEPKKDTLGGLLSGGSNNKKDSSANWQYR